MRSNMTEHCKPDQEISDAALAQDVDSLHEYRQMSPPGSKILLEPSSDSNRQSTHAIETDESGKLDENSVVDWLKKDGIVVAVAIGAAVGTVITLGAAAPALVAAAGFATMSGIGVSMTIAAVGTAGGMMASEACKEGLYHADIGLGPGEQSRLGGYLAGNPEVDSLTGEKRERTLINHVVAPYTVDFLGSTALTFATMGVGHLVAKGLNASLTKLAHSRMGNFIARNAVDLKESAAASKNLDKLTAEHGKKTFSQKFVHELVEEGLDEMKETAAEDAIEKSVGRNNAALGFLAGALVGGAKGVKFDSFHRGAFGGQSNRVVEAPVTNGMSGAVPVGEALNLQRLLASGISEQRAAGYGIDPALLSDTQARNRLSDALTEWRARTGTDFDGSSAWLNNPAVIADWVSTMHDTVKQFPNADLKDSADSISREQDRLDLRYRELMGSVVADLKVQMEAQGIDRSALLDSDLYYDYLGAHPEVSAALDSLSEKREQLAEKKRSLEAVLQQNAQKLEQSLDKFTDKHGIPRLRISPDAEFGDGGIYVSGAGSIRLGKALLTGELAPADTLALLAHEVNHSEQDYQTLRSYLDEAAVGTTADEAQIAVVKERFLSTHGQEIEDDYLASVIGKRNGVKLTEEERLRVRVMEGATEQFIKNVYPVTKANGNAVVEFDEFISVTKDKSPTQIMNVLRDARRGQLERWFGEGNCRENVEELLADAPALSALKDGELARRLFAIVEQRRTELYTQFRKGYTSYINLPHEKESFLVTRSVRDALPSDNGPHRITSEEETLKRIFRLQGRVVTGSPLPPLNSDLAHGFNLRRDLDM